MKRANILGLGISGNSAIKALGELGYTDFNLFDDNLSKTDNNISSLSSFIDDGTTLTIVSPGLNHRVIDNYPNKNNSNISSEIDLGFQLLKKLNKKPYIIGITGTNGKSTVTNVITNILKSLGKNAVACGNIGIPFTKAILDYNADYYILELSSYQIDLMKNTYFNSSCILNLSLDHQARYKDKTEYFLSKFKLFEHSQGSCFIQKSCSIDSFMEQNNIHTPQLKYFSSGFQENNETICLLNKYFYKKESFKLLGKHNIINLSNCLEMILDILNIDDSIDDLIPEDITDLVKNIHSLPHRLEFVCSLNGASVYNDSKATSYDAVIAALSLSGSQDSTRNINLLMGGRIKAKKENVTDLVNIINKKCKFLYFFGEDAAFLLDKLQPLLIGNIDIKVFKSMTEATEAIIKVSQTGDIILLSPAGESFDGFKSFAHRGDVFKSLFQNSNT